MKIANIEVSYIDHCGSDLSTVNSARVSFDKVSDWQNSGAGKDYAGVVYLKDGLQLHEADAKLIKYLAKHKHKSPFNHSFITVKVKAPIFVSRQLVKHKFMPWNEESRRYVDSEPEFYIPTTLRAKADNVKQGSKVEAIKDSDWYVPDIVLVSRECLEIYNTLLEQGVCAEQARMVLPQNMMVNWYWSGTLGAFADMLVLRLSSTTQKETRGVAEKIRDIVLPLFPISLEALLSNG
jgi:thymidylate synthase (FAD)